MMKQFFLSLTILLAIATPSPGQAETAKPRSDGFGVCAEDNSIVIANHCPGATLGMKVNAADAVLGNKPGEIWLYGGGDFGDENSRIVISSHHVFRVFPGTYRSTSYNGVIWLKDYSSLICEDRNSTVIEEPTHAVGPQNLWAIVRVYNTTYPPYGEVSENISIKDCHFKGTRTDFSAYHALQMDNCHNCEVSGNWLDNLHAQGVHYGGGYVAGAYAQGSSLHHNLFTGVAAVNAAVVNGRDISIHDNIFLRPGQAGTGQVIDLEPNGPGDICINISITNNLISTLDTAATVVNAILIQNGANSPNYGPVLVSGNNIVGEASPGLSKLITGIVLGLNARGVHVLNNSIQYATWYPIAVNGTQNTISGNYIFGNGAASRKFSPIYLYPTSANNLVSGNNIYCDAARFSSCSTAIVNAGASSNIISNNTRSGIPRIAAGSGAGTRARVSVAGDEQQGYITVITGAAPSALAVVATITYANDHGNGPISIPLAPANANAASLTEKGQVYVDLDSSSGAGFVIKAGAKPLAPLSTYSWFYGPVKP